MRRRIGVRLWTRALVGLACAVRGAVVCARAGVLTTFDASGLQSSARSTAGSSKVCAGFETRAIARRLPEGVVGFGTCVVCVRELSGWSAERLWRPVKLELGISAVRPPRGSGFRLVRLLSGASPAVLRPANPVDGWPRSPGR